MSFVAIFYSLRRALFGCPSRLDTVFEIRARAGERQTAGRFGECTGDARKSWIILTPCGNVCRQHCPRFQAIWKAFLSEEKQIRESDLFAGVRQQKADLRDGDREIAEIHGFNVNARTHVRRPCIEAGGNVKADSIMADRAQKVDDSKQRTEQGNAERNAEGRIDPTCKGHIAPQSELLPKGAQA